MNATVAGDTLHIQGDSYAVSQLIDFDWRKERHRQWSVVVLASGMSMPHRYFGFTEEEVRGLARAVRAIKPSLASPSGLLDSAPASRHAPATTQAPDDVVGVYRKATLPRLLGGGIVGGLLFKKRVVARRKDV